MIPADFVTIIVIPLLSLTGLLAGMILSYIARQELSVGKKYFVIFYRIIFVLLSLIILYFLSLYMLLVFLFFAILLLMLDLKKHHTFLFYVHYLFFLAGYFLSGQQTIIAAMIFWYGLPVGTLLWMKME
ncbi:MAG: hypothetical protein AABX31_04705 [Nanoarchaeota archaeon]